MDTDWYVTMVRDTAAIATFFFDLTGGKWSLALFCETLEELLDTGNIAGVTTVIQKLYEAADQEFTWANQINASKGALFVDALADALSADDVGDCRNQWPACYRYRFLCISYS